ncbi:MAG: phosphoglucosamine mutase [Deltaproteobacteria bacterium]|nr:phosphoglucosamine mutase [Deltaproteobacteria bacterium]MBI3294484.1 phosphoglucosamine mutase [Deltaproteobacteria bacterium]
MGKLFGTDGIRGIANQPPMTSELAMAIGRATAYLFCQNDARGFPKNTKVVIGKDTRLSGYMLENALAAGFCSMGVKVFLVGPLPTPGIAFITRSMRADAGVVISASHNPYQYNGIKIFDRHGFKLPDQKEEEIEAILSSETLEKFRPTMEFVGRATRIDDAIGRYIVYIKDTFPQELTLDGIRIVLDAANGAAYKIAPIVFEELGAEVFTIHNTPNGRNINDQCGAVYPQSMCKAVHEHRAEIGIALDGDGDRVTLSDENGEIVDGDQIMAICALNMLANDELKERTLVATPMSNMGLEVAIRKAGGKVIRAPVGDRYIVETMRKHSLNLGGEQSGHIVFLDHNTTGDALIAALKVLAIMKRTGRPLSELKRQMVQYPQVLENVFVRNKEDFAQYPKIVQTIKRVENALGEGGRVVVRYSGTEPLARVMVEGEDFQQIQRYVEEIAHSIRAQLG